MTANWNIASQISAPAAGPLLQDERVQDDTPTPSTDVDLRALPAGARILVTLFTVKNVGNTGGTWVLQESETDGGSYTACTTSTITAIAAGTGLDQQLVSVLPNPDKPFVQAVFTGTDADTDCTLTVTVSAAPLGI